MSLQNRIAAATRKPASALDTVIEDSSRRWAQRKSAHNSAQILFDGITMPFSCLVRDISSTGVRLEMTKNKYNPDAATGFVPTYFSLLIPLDRTRVECQSMWRRGSFIGARFLGAVTQLPASAKREPMLPRKK